MIAEFDKAMTVAERRPGPEVGRGRPPVCDGREGRRSVAVVEAVYRSAREKRVVDLPRERR